jgi:DNA repair protein RecO (recombination protein O)
MNFYEAMLLSQLGYGGERPDMAADLPAQFETFRAMHPLLARYPLADSRGDVMAARVLLGERLARMVK